MTTETKVKIITHEQHKDARYKRERLRKFRAMHVNEKNFKEGKWLKQVAKVPLTGVCSMLVILEKRGNVLVCAHIKSTGSNANFHIRLEEWNYSKQVGFFRSKLLTTHYISSLTDTMFLPYKENEELKIIWGTKNEPTVKQLVDLFEDYRNGNIQLQSAEMVKRPKHTI